MLSPFRSLLLRGCVIWTLAYALPLAGLSLAISQWLGAQHVHRGVSMGVEAHHHATSDRHHHHHADASVLKVGGDAVLADVDQGDSPAAGWGLTLVADRGLRLGLHPGLAHEAPCHAAWMASDLRRAPPLRPPRAGQAPAA